MNKVTTRYYDDDGYHYRTCDPSNLVDEENLEQVAAILGNLLDVMHNSGFLDNHDLTNVFGDKYEFVDGDES